MPLQLLQSLGWALLNSLWQMALLWIVYQLVGLFLQKAKATQRANLACTLLLTGFGWFVSNFINVYIDISAGETISSPLAAITYINWLPQSLPWISGLYLSLLLIPVFRFIRNYRYVQIIRRYGLNKIPVDWRIYVQQHSALMGIRKKYRSGYRILWLPRNCRFPETHDPGARCGDQSPHPSTIGGRATA